MKKFKNPIVSVGDDNEIVNNDQSIPSGTYEHKEEVFFAFIDALGFTKAFDVLRESKDGEDGDSDLAQRYADVFEYYFFLINSSVFNTQNQKSNPGIWYAGQTSDSLYFYTGNSEILKIFIRLYGHFSLYAMSQNIFFRGGIAKGRIYYQEAYQFYGTGVINAYKLESKIAKNPAIFIDENTYSVLKEDDGFSNIIGEEKPCSGRFRLNPFFAIDTSIKSCVKEGTEIKTIDRDIIRRNIESNMKKYEFDETTYSKYLYLKNNMKW